MRKAFDANVPKFRPRLKSGSASSEEPARTEPGPAEPRAETAVAESAPPAQVVEEIPVADLPPAPERNGIHGEQAARPADEPLPLALSIPREEAALPAAAAAFMSAAVTSAATVNPPPTAARAAPSTATPSVAPAGQPPQPRDRAPARDEHGQGSSTPVADPPATAPSLAAPPQLPAARPAAAAELMPAFPFDESPDVQARRERLLQVKRKVAQAARPAPVMPPFPEAPARAGESALALVRDLEVQLERARDVEAALRADLDQARAELARGAAESRKTVERLAVVEQQMEEKRAVLQEMLTEMSALEEERDGAVSRAQALAALDEERQGLLDGLSGRAEQAEKGRAEAQAEADRLGDELDERAADAARLRGALAQVTRERDELERELSEARRERDDLAEARKALEQVHEALATARSRLS